MKNWFTSLNGAITLSVIALLTEVWRGFLDAMFVFPNEFGDESSMQFGALIFTALFGAWAWSQPSQPCSWPWACSAAWSWPRARPAAFCASSTSASAVPSLARRTRPGSRFAAGRHAHRE